MANESEEISIIDCGDSGSGTGEIGGNGCCCGFSSSSGGGGGGGGMWPEPIKGVRESGPPPFVANLYKLVSDKATDSIVSWLPPPNATQLQSQVLQGATSFVIWDEHKFINDILPFMSKSTSFESFITQLNNYGFKKVSWNLREYANEWFQEGKPELLKNVKRRTRPPKAICQKNERLDGLDALKLEIQKFKDEEEELDIEMATFKEYVQSNMFQQKRVLQAMAKAISSTFGQTRAQKMEEKEAEDGFEIKQDSTTLGQESVHEMEKNEVDDCHEVVQDLITVGQQHETDKKNEAEDGLELKHDLTIVMNQNEEGDGHDHEVKQDSTMEGQQGSRKMEENNEMEDGQSKFVLSCGNEAEEELAKCQSKINIPLEDLIDNPMELARLVQMESLRFNTV